MAKRIFAICFAAWLMKLNWIFFIYIFTTNRKYYMIKEEQRNEKTDKQQIKKDIFKDTFSIFQY